MNDVAFTRSRWFAGGALVAVAAIATAGLVFSGSQGQAMLSTVGNSFGYDSGAPLPAGDVNARDALGSSRSGGEGQGGSPVGAQNANAALRDETRIVRTGTLQLQVDELGPALDDARRGIAALGGYISASRQTNDGERTIAQVTYRVPELRWEEALDALRGLAIRVIDEQTESLEVTGQLIDLGARIDNLRASEQALQRIAEQATTIKDVLEVESRLTSVRGQIEQLAAQKAHLEDQAGFATLTVTFGRQVVAVTEASAKFDPAGEADRATATLVEILQSVAAAGIWLGIVWLPILLVVGFIVSVVLFVLRRTGLMAKPKAAAVPPTAPAV